MAITPKYTKLLILKTYRYIKLGSDLNFVLCLTFGSSLFFTGNILVDLNENRFELIKLCSRFTVLYFIQSLG